MSRIWLDNLSKLQQFQVEFGHVNVPKGYVDQKLARLVTTLRQQKRYRTLKAERELVLLQLGFEFEPHQAHWQSVYNNVVEFYRLNGHASPSRRSDNEHERALADWVHRMHKLIRKGTLEADNVEKLKLVNIDDSPTKHRLTKTGLPAEFEKMLGRLKRYMNEYSNNIHSEMADPALYQWILLQEKRINASLITPKEYSSLMNTGFTVENKAASWLKAVREK